MNQMILLSFAHIFQIPILKHKTVINLICKMYNKNKIPIDPIRKILKYESKIFSFHIWNLFDILHWFGFSRNTIHILYNVAVKLLLVSIRLSIYANAMVTAHIYACENLYFCYFLVQITAYNLLIFFIEFSLYLKLIFQNSVVLFAIGTQSNII